MLLAPILKIIPLECTKPAEQVFDLEKIRQGKAFEASIDNFITSLDNVKFQGLNLRGMLEEIGQHQGYDKEIIKEIIDRIGEFEQ